MRAHGFSQLYSRFLQQAPRAPALLLRARDPHRDSDGLLEDGGNSSEGSLGDMGDYLIDNEDEAQDAAADFDAGVVWSADFGHDGRCSRTDGLRAAVAAIFEVAIMLAVSTSSSQR